MEYFKSTSQIRAEVKNNYVYVRDLSEKTAIKVANVLQQVTDENFSQVWDLLNKIKGVSLNYARN